MCSVYPTCVVLFFFSSRRRHTRYWRDWSSDVCSSDLALGSLVSPTIPHLGIFRPALLGNFQSALLGNFRPALTPICSAPPGSTVSLFNGHDLDAEFTCQTAPLREPPSRRDLFPGWRDLDHRYK